MNDFPGKKALEVAQDYLNWYDFRQKTAERVCVGLKPLHFEILCTDGVCVPMSGPMEQEMLKAVSLEWTHAKEVVAALRKQMRAEELS